MGMDPNHFHMDPSLMFQNHTQSYSNYMFQQNQGSVSKPYPFPCLVLPLPNTPFCDLPKFKEDADDN